MKTNFTVHINAAGNINAYVGDEFFQVSNKHPNYNELKQAAMDGEADEFLRIYKAFEVRFAATETYDNQEMLTRTKESVEYRGRTIDDPVLVAVINSYNTSCDALKLFLDNMFLNPHWESIKQLGSFLKHGNFPLTEDGCFLGYKAVRPDFLDLHSGTMDNSVGKRVVMPRKDVTFDPKIACSAGLHVGTYAYAQDFGRADSKYVLVKVNPAHVVSVPNDYNHAKLRCSEYTVVGEVDGLLNIDIVYSTEGLRYKTENFFADLYGDSKYRRCRAKYVAPVDDCDEDCDYDEYEDCDDDELEFENYVCSNCCWEESVRAVEDSIGCISFCPACGSEIEAV